MLNRLLPSRLVLAVPALWLAVPARAAELGGVSGAVPGSAALLVLGAVGLSIGLLGAARQPGP